MKEWSKLATTLRIPLNMSVKFPLATWGRKENSSTCCMSRKTWCRSDKLSTKGCKFDSRISVASLKKKGRSLRTGTEKGGCSSSTPMKSEPHCLRKERRSNWASTYGTRDSTMLTSRGFVRCRQRTSFLDCRNLVAGTAKSA